VNRLAPFGDKNEGERESDERSALCLPQPKKINHGTMQKKREEFGTTDAHRFTQIRGEAEESSNDFVLR
jgi:hypothetical protein